MGSHPEGQKLDKELKDKVPTEDLLLHILEQLELLGQELIQYYTASRPRDQQQQWLAKLSKMYIYAEHRDKTRQVISSTRQKQLEAVSILDFAEKPLKISQELYQKITSKLAAQNLSDKK